MNSLLQKACDLADRQDKTHVAVADWTRMGGDIYYLASNARLPLIAWAQYYEARFAVIHLADKLANGWEAY